MPTSIKDMDRSEVFSGKSVDDCKKKAAEAFGVAVTEISFEILEEGKRGLFGKVKEEAKVLAGYNLPKEEIIEEIIAEAETKAEEKIEEEEINIDEKIEKAISFVEKMLDKMGIQGKVTAWAKEDDKAGIGMEIDSGGSGAIIGRRGETLDALQYLTSLAINRGSGCYIRISIDSNGYREKREVTLRGLAKKLADKAIKSGRPQNLEPMNPYERRIIHSEIADIEGVSSKSIGEDPYRKVVVTPDKLRKGNGRRDGGKKKYDSHHKIDLKTSFEKDYKRPKPEDDIHAGLYGKIEL